MTRIALALAAAAAMAASTAQTPSKVASGTIRGRVVLNGPAPGNAIIRMGMDPKCSALNAGKRVVQESALVARDGGVANAFVRLEGSFPQTPIPSEPVVIDQRACVYGPRVVGMRVGQVLRIRNSDGLLHNTHSSSAVGNGFNVGQPAAGMTFDFTPRASETMLTLGCDIHRWMTAYVGVMPHPYFAVSGATGSFEIGKVPPGTYTILSWHERFGDVKKTVTVKAGAVAMVAFQYESAGNAERQR